MDFPFEKQRADFPILKEKIQLCSCSQGALCQQVEAALHSYLDSLRRSGMDWETWMEVVVGAKASFARLINAEPEEVAVLSSVSEAASAVASALDFKGSRKRVVVTEVDFPTIGHVWLAQERNGAQVSFVEGSDYRIPLSAYGDYVDERTLLTSISHQAYYNGFRQDLRAVAEKVHAAGSLLFVDAYQSVGVASIDVKDSGVDFLAAGAQKYMLGIPGIAFLYVRGELAERLEPTRTGWFGRKDPFAFDIRLLDYAEKARRFEAGTPPVANAYAARAAIDYLLDTGIEEIEGYLEELVAWGMEEALRRGFSLRTPLGRGQYGPNIAIVADDSAEMEVRLRREGIIVSARNDVVRVAPHLYNTREDLNAAFDALERVIYEGAQKPSGTS